MALSAIARTVNKVVKVPGRLGRRIKQMLPGPAARPFNWMDQKLVGVAGGGAGVTILGLVVIFGALSFLGVAGM